MVVSSDGGNNFSPLTIADVNSDNGNDVNGKHGCRQRPDARSRLQPGDHGQPGAARRARAAQAGDRGIPGGQVAVAWDDFGTTMS